MEYYIDIDREKRKTAGAKAPGDVAALCASLGMERIVVPREAENGPLKKLWLMAACNYEWLKVLFSVKKGARILYQHPMYGHRVAMTYLPMIRKRKNCQFIAIVHDLESLRKGIEGVIANREKTAAVADNGLLKEFDYVICHNDRMKAYLLSQGFREEQLVSLGLFDYLAEAPAEREVEQFRSIAIAGNLAKGKSGYVYRLAERGSGVTIHLFGINYEEQPGSGNVVYHGALDPNELPSRLEGGFGLVWDGQALERCAGNTGEYLRYNNPHKTSLYLAAGMPVIVWEEAAVADFVREQDVGIVIDDLNRLEERLSCVTPEDYCRMQANARRIGARLRSGAYFKEALQECFRRGEAKAGEGGHD